MTKCNKPITQPMNCETETCVYMTECNKEKCKQRYIGETKGALQKDQNIEDI